MWPRLLLVQISDARSCWRSQLLLMLFATVVMSAVAAALAVGPANTRSYLLLMLFDTVVMCGGRVSPEGARGGRSVGAGIRLKCVRA